MTGEETKMPLRFAFRFDPRLRGMARLFGIRPETAFVEIDGDLVARFGPWQVATPAENLGGATITGPYRTAKVAGPAHLSLADRGLTFGTSTDRGVCIRFRRPVRGIDPLGIVRHPALTVTVEDCEGLVRAVEQAERGSDSS
jgi:hypothetical protein